ncbi:hypothetical protein [Dictyobacter kobayashii]|uniref:hypothetical protein n=1 Tax=Dictyobacter kobayashii TaxID=2014872 RepID=UPI000F81ABCC|nr:hypothetical protein [Dictyobacter kobayashii]
MKLGVRVDWLVRVNVKLDRLVGCSAKAEAMTRMADAQLVAGRLAGDILLVDDVDGSGGMGAESTGVHDIYDLSL